MDLSIFPNEIICQLYQYLNPNDQLSFAMTSRSIRSCFPNWKRDHKKSFINCIKQINEIKYIVNIWTETNPNINTSTIMLERGYCLIASIVLNCNSQRINGNKITRYYFYFHSSYLPHNASNNEYLFIKAGFVDKYDCSIPLSNYLDMSNEGGLNNQTMVYRHTIY